MRRQQSPNETHLKELWAKVFGRLLGLTLAHEIAHSLIGPNLDIDNNNHSSTPLDLLVPGDQIRWERATAVILLNEPRFPAEGTYEFEALEGTLYRPRGKTRERMKSWFPVRPRPH